MASKQINWKAERVVRADKGWRRKHWNKGDEGAILAGVGDELPFVGEPRFFVRKLNGKWIVKTGLEYVEEAGLLRLHLRYEECENVAKGIEICDKSYLTLVKLAVKKCREFAEEHGGANAE